jgi:sugar transferase (PEP-CTERM/EpsH1 system associated)
MRFAELGAANRQILFSKPEHVSRFSFQNPMRILFITPRFPYPPLKGDSLRTYHQIRVLSREHSVSLLAMSEGEVSRGDYARVAELCERVSVVPLPKSRAMFNLAAGVSSRLPLQVSYYRSAALREKLREMLAEGQFDVVHATLIRVLPYVWDLQQPPVVVDLIDSLTLNLQDRRDKVRGPMRVGYELEYGRVRRYEQEVVRHFRSLVVSSPADKEVLGEGNVTVIPNGVDLDSFPFAGQEGREDNLLVFTGNMGYHPNEEAVVWFAGEVWPLVRERHPGLRFQVVGTNPGERVRALADGSNGIEVLGKVPDVAACLHRATISVAPMHTGSGIQNKVLEAMSTGTPVVATSTANRGVRAIPERDLLVADSAADFAAAVSRLLGDPQLRDSLAEQGRRYVQQEFRWEQHGARLVELYEAAAGLPRTANQSRPLAASLP